MRKLVAFAAAWLAAAAVAVVVAWQGVGIVTNQVTDERPAPLAAGEVRALSQEAGAQAKDAGEPTTTTLAPAAEPTVTGETPGATPTTASRGPTTATTVTAPGATPGSATPVPTTTAPAPTTTAPPAPGETRTYNLVGGSVALRFAPTGVTVAWATPAAGFEVEVEPEHGNGVRVGFESDDHRSRVTGWWDGGPQDETREEER